MTPTVGPTDRELAASGLTGATLAVALAVRALGQEGADITVQAVMAITGHSQSAVYNARGILRSRWPDAYAQRSSVEESTVTPIPQLRKTPGHDPVPTQGVLAPALPLMRHPETTPAVTSTDLRNPLAPWRVALAGQLMHYDGRRSWDAYAVYSLAWDSVLDLVHEPADPTGDLIGLTIDYLERMLDPEPVDRGQVALLVRQFGKAALFGLSKALGVTETTTTRDLYRYARRVAANVVEEIGAAQ